jgi:hypothetical protein
VGRFDIERKTLGKTTKIALSIIIVLPLSARREYQEKKKAIHPV